MGTWGAGLYSADMALDLRATIGALARLPFDEERIVDVLCDGEQKAANDPQDEDHTTFWLVLADQFAKRGLASAQVRTKALDIIDNERDLTMLAACGMGEADLRKRAATLQKLRAALSSTPRPARRSTLKGSAALHARGGRSLCVSGSRQRRGQHLSGPQGLRRGALDSRRLPSIRRARA